MKAQEPHSSEGRQCPRERVCCDTGPQERHGSEKTPPQQKRCSSQGRVPATKLRSLRSQPGSCLSPCHCFSSSWFPQTTESQQGENIRFTEGRNPGVATLCFWEQTVRNGTRGSTYTRFQGSAFLRAEISRVRMGWDFKS